MLKRSIDGLRSVARWPHALAGASLLLIALLTAAPLWGPGIVNTRGGGDSPFLLQRTHQMAENLRAGVFPVRWMPDAAYGYGYPFFSYYAALPYYLTGALTLLGLNVLAAVKLVQTAGCVAAALAMYAWMLTLTRRRWAGWLAGVAYAVAPFHLVNVYVRGDSLSEFTAFAFYPLILWALDSGGGAGSKQERPRWVAAAVAYAGLLLTHNLSAAIFSPFALLYLVLMWLRRKGRAGWRNLAWGLLALGLGFLLAAWFWLPAVTELNAVQLGPSTEGYFHYSRHFRSTNLIQRGLLFDYRVSADGRTPFAMGLAQAMLAALGGLVLLIRALRRALRTRWGFVVLGLLISTLMITPLSKPLWDHLPVLPVVQFPWRFLSVQALFTAAATAALIDARGQPPDRRPLLAHALPILIGVALMATTLLSLHVDRLLIDPEDVTVERLQLYELFSGNIGTTIRYEWLPKTVNPRPFTSETLVDPEAPWEAIPLDGAALGATLVDRGPTRQAWRVTGQGGRIAFPLFYWPGWRGTVDGEPVDTAPVEGSGFLTLAVPPGDHEVVLRLGRTPVRAAAEIVSLVAWIGLLVVVIVRRPRPRAAWALLLLAIPLAWAVGQLDAPSAAPVETDLTMDFAQMPYLHHNPGGVDFSGAAQLAACRFSADELTPGDRLDVTLDWDAPPSGATTATLTLVTPAAVRHEVLPLAQSTLSLDNCATPCRVAGSLVLPEATSRGLYLVQLRLFGPEGEIRARTPAGHSRGVLYLRPVRVTGGPDLPADAALLASFGPDVRLHAATVEQTTADQLAVEFAWSTARQLAVNYGISLRLLDPAGETRLTFDTQPGYGFLPTSLWRPGEQVVDRYLLALPDDLPRGHGYQLEVVLY
ncbi:MAG: 6-pyruvoyl-tetrahydropterin synthase-related protein, partial [Anaerolineae bacterium]